MVKCVVTGCPNRSEAASRGTNSRPPKRFFSFPTDPGRVKVWLAALRQTDKRDSARDHLICEDHFLPDDIGTSGVVSEAIPIMPPCLEEEPLAAMNPWGAESSDEEEQWSCTATDDAPDGAKDGDEAAGSPDAVKTAEEGPAKQDPQAPSGEAPADIETLRAQNRYMRGLTHRRADVSLGRLARQFLELLGASPSGVINLREVAVHLGAPKRRIYDITAVLGGISLTQKQSASTIKWIGKTPISTFLQRKRCRLGRELDNLKLVEDTLDTLIKSCAKQLFDMTDDTENTAWAYVTKEDISKLHIFQGRTVIAVKAPEETTLEVPAPREDSIQVCLRASRGPITVLTAEVETPGEEERDALIEKKRSVFQSLDESRIETALMRKES